MRRSLRLMVVALLCTALGVWGGMQLTPKLHRAAHEGAGPATGAGEEQPLYTCGMHPQVIQDHPGNCPICGMKLMPMKDGSAGGGAAATKPKGERKIKYWVAPMDPTYIRDAPGKSPMGMELVPVYEEEGQAATENPDAIRIDPTMVQNMGVRTAVLARRDLTHTLRTIGRVTEDENRLTEVNTKVGGWIEKLYVAETGQQVKRGDPLLTLYAPDLVTTQREYLLALENLRKVERSPFPEVVEGAKRLLASTRERLALWDINNAQIDRLARTGTVERTLTLYSPFDGVVLERHVVEGTYAKPGEPLLKLADLSHVWVLADIYESELPWVHRGTAAVMTLTYHPGQQYEGRLDYLYPTLDPKTRVVQARLLFDNPQGDLKPGMYADVALTPKVAASVVVVPKEAVIHSGRRDLAFVRLPDNRFEPRTLTLGPEGDDGQQVLAGLAEGETVVTSAQFLLDSESQLKEAVAKLLAARAPSSGRKPSDETPSPGGRGIGGGGGGSQHAAASPDRPPSPTLPHEGGGGVSPSGGDETPYHDLFTAYLAIQAALASDTVKGVAAQADALMAALPPLVGKGVTPEQMERLHDELAGLKSKDLQRARGAFGPISEVILELAAGPGRAAAAQLGLSGYHCPMSHANWLQKGEVANPYFGAAMLRCGEPLEEEQKVEGRK